MKCNGSIAAGACTNWLGFELDPDHSPNPGTGFTQFFWILAGYLNKLWTYFDEILWVHSCGVCTIWLRFELDPDYSPDPGSGHVFKIARQIALKVMDGFQWNFINEVCESRKTAFNFRSDTDHIRDAVSISRFYPDYWVLTTDAAPVKRLYCCVTHFHFPAAFCCGCNLEVYRL